jgi:RNA polymerase sigma-70 factor (ECF subfamily)
MDSDASIAARCVLGDREAWEQLVARKEGLVFSTCLRFTGSKEEARDATQEVFLKVLVAIRTYDPNRGTFSGWLGSVVRGVIIDRWRKKARRTEVLARSDGFLDSLPDPRQRLSDRGALEERDAAIIRRAIARLPGGIRDAVLLRYYSGLGYREISEALGLPEGTVKTRLHRGHAKLALRLSPNLSPR